MTTATRIAVTLVRAVAAFALSLSTAAPVAADWAGVASVPSTYVGEFGTRSGSALISRLDYDDMNICQRC